MSQQTTSIPDPWGPSKRFLKEIYLPSRDPRIRQLFTGMHDIPGTMLPLEQRHAQAKALSDAGLKLDDEIDGQGWDALTTQLRRQFYGYTRWPSMAQGSNVDPVSGAIDYSNPAFDFVVSTSPGDYPSLNLPDIPLNRYVGQRANAEGMYNTINSPETATNPQTGEVFKVGDKLSEVVGGQGGQPHSFMFVKGGDLYYWLLDT